MTENAERDSPIQSFEDLEVYQTARQLCKAVSRFCKTLPREEEYRLKDQIVRSSRSVTNNIAEGYGRHHHQENLQFCRQARGSLTETLDHFNIGLDEGYLSEDEYQSLRDKLMSVHRLLNGYINYLKKRASEHKSR